MTEITINHVKFTPWPARKTADPRNASDAQFLHGLTEIVASEGPIQALPLFQTYAKASGLMKIAAPVRKRFERALLAGEKSGAVMITRENDPEAKGEDDSVCWIVRLPDMPEVIVRDLGNRGFADIPMRELAAVVLDVRTSDDLMGRDDIYRAVLAHYGLQKVTALVKRRLDTVLADYF